MGTFVIQEQTEKWVISQVFIPHSLVSCLDLELSSHENKLAVAIYTNCIGKINNLRVYLISAFNKTIIKFI
jgi:hypothetical protein